MKEICKNCLYWQVFDDRVHAHISKARSDHYRNRIELRRCRWNPHPSQDHNWLYTDQDYHCSEFREVE